MLDMDNYNLFLLRVLLKKTKKAIQKILLIANRPEFLYTYRIVLNGKVKNAIGYY